MIVVMMTTVVTQGSNLHRSLTQGCSEATAPAAGRAGAEDEARHAGCRAFCQPEKGLKKYKPILPGS